jgi:hypothetical protein
MTLNPINQEQIYHNGDESLLPSYLIWLVICLQIVTLGERSHPILSNLASSMLTDCHRRPKLPSILSNLASDVVADCHQGGLFLSFPMGPIV